jgi:hypothetical protein
MGFEQLTEVDMRLHLSLASALLALPLLAGTASAQEKKIQRSDLPAAVEKTVATETRGATIRGFATETEDGHTFYEVETTVGGRTRDLLIEADGTLAEVEEEVSIDTLPAAVKAGLLAKAGKGTIERVEAVTKHGKLVSYDAAVVTNGKHSEVSVAADGRMSK